MLCKRRGWASVENLRTRTIIDQLTMECQCPRAYVRELKFDLGQTFVHRPPLGLPVVARYLSESVSARCTSRLRYPPAVLFIDPIGERIHHLDACASAAKSISGTGVCLA